VGFTDISEIKLDGGNVVRYEDRVIMTDAIFRENGIDIKDKTGQTQLSGKLKNYFNSEIIIIPHQPDDPLSHSDGVVRFLDRNTVLVNNFSSVTDKKLEESKHYLDNLFGVLGKAGLNIIQIPYAPINEIGEDNMPVAFGIYINYLETSEYVFLPQFQEGFVEKDKEALQIFSKIFKSVGKKVIPVNSRSIAYGGGVLNCITWN
jgi:agmatine deiminase